MEKKETIELYVAPEVEILEVQVEKGFAGSPIPGPDVSDSSGSDSGWGGF